MHSFWNFVPKRMLVSKKTHVAVFDHRKQALCGEGMPHAKRGDFALLPFIESMVDCGHCKTILSCHPQNNPLVTRHMSPRVEHKEMPMNRFKMHPSCSAHSKPARIISSGNEDYFTVVFQCEKNIGNKHFVTTRHVWPESVNSWW